MQNTKRISRNPFVALARNRKHGIEKPLKGRGSYRRHNRHKNKMENLNKLLKGD
jgi:stalled ribosome alternative rescue factor ArfA